jgi:hypothetical protein
MTLTDLSSTRQNSMVFELIKAFLYSGSVKRTDQFAIVPFTSQKP